MGSFDLAWWMRDGAVRSDHARASGHQGKSSLWPSNPWIRVSSSRRKAYSVQASSTRSNNTRPHYYRPLQVQGSRHSAQRRPKTTLDASLFASQSTNQISTRHGVKMGMEWKSALIIFLLFLSPCTFHLPPSNPPPAPSNHGNQGARSNVPHTSSTPRPPLLFLEADSQDRIIIPLRTHLPPGCSPSSCGVYTSITHHHQASVSHFRQDGVCVPSTSTSLTSREARFRLGMSSSQLSHPWPAIITRRYE